MKIQKIVIPEGILEIHFTHAQKHGGNESWQIASDIIERLLHEWAKTLPQATYVISEPNKELDT